MKSIRKLMVAAAASAAFCIGSQASTFQVLGNYVWYDVNEDGLQDGTDVPAPDVVVWLYEWDPVAGAGVYSAQTTTDTLGEYYFFVQSGKQYYVQFFPPTGFGFTTLDAGLNEAVDSDASPGGVTALTSVFADGQVDYDWDAGLVETAGGDEISELGDYVWCDLNRNGIQDAGTEVGAGGVTVNLYDASGVTLVLLDTTQTGPMGQYSFPDLAAGSYVVQFVLPAGAAFTQRNQGANDGLDSDADFGGFSQVVTLDGLESDLSVDAGLICGVNGGGTGTPGYWKNHPQAWPVTTITIGGTTYTRERAIALMKQSTTRNKWLNMFEQLVSSMLNAYAGNEVGCIGSTIDEANAWMAATPHANPLSAPPSVPASSSLWQQPVGSNSRSASVLHTTLDNYNNGRLCAPHRN